MVSKTLKYTFLFLGILLFLAITSFVTYILYNRSDVPTDIYDIFHCSDESINAAKDNIKNIKAVTLKNIDSCEILKVVVWPLCFEKVSHSLIYKKMRVRKPLECFLQSLAVRMQLEPTYDMKIVENALVKYYKEVKGVTDERQIRRELDGELKKIPHIPRLEELIDQLAPDVNRFGF